MTTATEETIDLETCFGTGRLGQYVVTELLGHPGVEIGDRFVVDTEGEPWNGCRVAASVRGAAPVVGIFVDGERIGSWVQVASYGGYEVAEISDCRILGVVRGLIRIYPTMEHSSIPVPA